MRICYIADARSIHTKRWLSFFAGRGHDVHLITYKPARIDGVRMHTLPDLGIPHLSLLAGIPAASILIEKIEPDLVHAHYAVKYGWTAALSNFHPFVLTVWGSDVVAPGGRVQRRLNRLTFGRADLVTTDCAHLYPVLEEAGCARGKIKTVFFGTDTERFKPVPHEYNLGIVSLRTLKPMYDIATLVCAVPRILKEVPSASFTIFGAGPEEGNLKALARRLGVADSIGFAGQVSQERLEAVLPLMGICVSTSLRDAGLSAGTAEAMSCGLPVVVTDQGDNRKWVEDGVNGFIFPPSDSEALAGRVVALLKDASMRARMGVAGRAVIEARDNYRTEMAKMEKIYEDLIKR